MCTCASATSETAVVQYASGGIGGALRSEEGLQTAADGIGKRARALRRDVDVHVHDLRDGQVLAVACPVDVEVQREAAAPDVQRPDEDVQLVVEDRRAFELELGAD